MEIISRKDWSTVNMFSPKLSEILKQYYYVGGMPEAVQAFSENQDWKEVREIQNEILKSYDYDFSKHAPADVVPRIRMLWNWLNSVKRIENSSTDLLKREPGQENMKLHCNGYLMED